MTNIRRQGFLASIAAGLGLTVIPEPKDMEKYYKVDTIERIPEPLPIPGNTFIACSGVTICNNERKVDYGV